MCGKTGGKPFLNVTRPDPTSLNCPEGTVACSTNTTADNTICYPPKDLDLCPITDLYMYAPATHTPTNMTTSAYALGWNLAVGKNGDRLPLTE